MNREILGSEQKEGKRVNLSREDFATIFVNDDIEKREEAMKRNGLEYDKGEIEISIGNEEIMKVSTKKAGFGGLHVEKE